MATEIREGKGGPKGRFCTTIDRKKGLEKYFKINFAEPKKPSTFAVPTTGNGTGRDARSRKKQEELKGATDGRPDNIESGRSVMRRRKVL